MFIIIPSLNVLIDRTLIKTPLSDYQQNNQYYQGQTEVRYQGGI